MTAGLVLFPFPLAVAADALGHKYSSLPSFPGYSGYWDMPNAQVLPDWHLRLGGAYTDPYYYVNLSVGMFDRLEINSRVTGIRGEITSLGADYGDYKDKSIDAKLLVFREGDFWPAVALGATDIHGTGLFTSRYLVGTKHWGDWNVSLGLGQGLLGGKSWEDRGSDIAARNGDDAAFDYLTSGDTDFSIFGGLEYAVSERLFLSAEYSSIAYEKVRGGKEAVWPVNFGLKYNLWQGVYLSAAFMRGEEVSGGVFVELPLDPEGPLGWSKEKPPIRQEREVLLAATADEKGLAEVLTKALVKDGFGSVKVIVDLPHVWVELENDRYNSTVLAFRRAFQVVDLTAPATITQVFLVLSANGVFHSGLKTGREHMRTFLESRIDDQTFVEFCEMSQDREELWASFDRGDGLSGESSTQPSRWSVAFKPKLSMFLNDPSGFFKTKFALDIVGKGEPWPGGLAVVRWSLPIQNDISTSNKVTEQEPTRTDLVNYNARKEPHFTSYGFDQLFELPTGAKARFGVGAFEAAYAGVGGEVFKFFKDGQYGVGLSGAMVWKRDLENDFQLDDNYSDPYSSYHLNLYGRPFPGSGLELGMRVGRFLAGDHGVRFEVCRTFKHFTLGAWYTVTDTSDFTAASNKGYHDKGVFFSFPLSIFDTKPRGGRLNLSLSPWTRDPGQSVSQFRSLYPLGSEPETPWDITRQIQEMRW
jgi:hypothetical protein